jgi:hypothetical protein
MKKLSGAKTLALIATIIVILVIGAAVLILDPPSMQRKQRIDARRVRDLIDISQSVDSYWDRKKTLPLDLATLDNEPGLRIPLKDPETGLPYIYECTNTKSYRLCAVFSVDSSDEGPKYSFSRKWSHGAGKHCFDLKPPVKKDKNEEN